MQFFRELKVTLTNWLLSLTLVPLATEASGIEKLNKSKWQNYSVDTCLYPAVCLRHSRWLEPLKAQAVDQCQCQSESRSWPQTDTNQGAGQRISLVRTWHTTTHRGPSGCFQVIEHYLVNRCRRQEEERPSPSCYSINNRQPLTESWDRGTTF